MTTEPREDKIVVCHICGKRGILKQEGQPCDATQKVEFVSESDAYVKICPDGIFIPKNIIVRTVKVASGTWVEDHLNRTDEEVIAAYEKRYFGCMAGCQTTGINNDTGMSIDDARKITVSVAERTAEFEEKIGTLRRELGIEYKKEKTSCLVLPSLKPQEPLDAFGGNF